MLNYKILKPKNQTCFKCKYQFKQTTSGEQVDNSSKQGLLSATEKTLQQLYKVRYMEKTNVVVELND